MAFQLPENRQEVINKLETDVKASLPNSKPQLKPSFLNALIYGFSGRVFDFYANIRVLIAQIFPDTATGIYLERWATIYGLTRQSATQSRKNIVFNGTLSTVIPVGTTISYNGLSYLTTQEESVTAKSLTPTNAVRASNVVRLTFAEAHNLASNVLITTSGFTSSSFNAIDVEINVVSTTEIEYDSTGIDETASVFGTVAYENALVQVLSQESGTQTNISGDTDVSLGTPIIGINSTGKSTLDDVLSATDEETDESLRARLLARIRQYFGNFSATSIEEKAKEIAGTTRVKVYEVTPSAGQVTMYFMRDGDSSPIPSAFEVDRMNDFLNIDDETKIRPANTAESDFIISAPSAKTVNIQFSSLSPNTQDMKDNIQLSLEDFFTNSLDIGDDLNRDSLISFVKQTLDSQGNNPDFVLDIPASNVTVNNNEVAILGTVDYV